MRRVVGDIAALVVLVIATRIPYILEPLFSNYDGDRGAFFVAQYVLICTFWLVVVLFAAFRIIAYCKELK